MSVVAVIKDVFTLRSRGTVVVLEDGFAGVVPRDGSIRNGDITHRYIGPDLIHGRDANGMRRNWHCLSIQGEDTTASFGAGDTVELLSLQPG